MKKIIIPFAIFALFIANSLEAAPIKVWHEMHDNAPSAVNAEGILKASPNAIWETLIRFNDFAKFMPRVRESFFITQEGVDALKKTKTNHINKIQEIAVDIENTLRKDRNEGVGEETFSVDSNYGVLLFVRLFCKRSRQNSRVCYNNRRYKRDFWLGYCVV